jgi:4'-phosphopantetheinyl transferase
MGEWEKGRGEWHRPDSWPQLSPGEVHVWRAALEVTAADLQRFLTTLSSDERARAERFRFERDRRRFIAGRGLLRAVLAGYVSTAPESLGFTYNEYGRPSLDNERLQPPLHFNVSHSGEVALYAVARGRQLGVDVEWMRRDVACEEIARRFFAPGEVERFLSLPPSDRTTAFFACWTRKEAYIKAKSRGLSIPLDQFEVTLGPDESAELLRVEWDADESRRWSLVELPMDTGYKAALAVEGRDWTLRQWEWDRDTSSVIRHEGPAASTL